ncbi:MAG TPA: DEAD/DEAH box helicase family protein [Candidatus Cloacimonas acidaminovorans]|nr:DEAD/DEAH box helicase family protein [Candidatus Cloacimonas acidaminovorans]
MNIEKYLVLNKYLLSLLGVSEFKDLQDKLKDVSDINDKDNYLDVLLIYFSNKINEANQSIISQNNLYRYDENIKGYVSIINRHREPIRLKYFQYLAVLFTEILLDNIKNNQTNFIYDLNEFLERYKKENKVEAINDFTEDDLNKIAFWMATGSGKTLIMHINYYQFLHYKLFSPDSILLITPNEGLSKQHYEELTKSGIPCRLYYDNYGFTDSLKNKDEVLVIEMTKLVEAKKGGGVTISINAFEGRKLIFVDEGHKGRKAEEQKWAKLRDTLAENGMVFEYSATFGQILSEKNKVTLQEYAKAIIFDYSYKYFYLDGYGKDFSVINAKNIKVDETRFQETMFLANLLDFYEQSLIFEDRKGLAEKQNLEKPLWIFVGTTVTGSEEESDVVQIVNFLHKVIKDPAWVNSKLTAILTGKAEFKNESGEDIFANKFTYIKEKGLNIEDLFTKIFGGKGGFGIYELKSAKGEFGLKTGENQYFGVINIGDVSSFKKQLEKIGLPVETDAISESLFDHIKAPNSSVNILIGSKKFIEGWDTWRVSSMGLLNIGTGQGPQIIQLFGRGVRLKGQNMTLKRSMEKDIKQLENLNIYGIRADYLSKFLEVLSKEEMDLETIEIPVQPNNVEKWETLYTLAKKDVDFNKEKVLFLKEENFSITLDLMPKLSAYLSQKRNAQGIASSNIAINTNELKSATDDDPRKKLNLFFDWNKIWLELYEYKLERGYWNLILNRDFIKNYLLYSDKYKILATPETLQVNSIEDIPRLENIALQLMKKYIDQFYNFHLKKYEMEHLYYAPVTEDSALSVFAKPDDGYNYTIQISKNKENNELIANIKALVQDLDKLMKEETNELPRIYFDKHLYLPILLRDTKIENMHPEGLVESEKVFISGLKNYLVLKKNEFTNKEIYLLRNFPKSGIGFFNLSGFYPDFIMWVKYQNKQIICFLDPKGLEHQKSLDSEKVQLHKEIKEIEKQLGNKDIILESFVLSITPYDSLITGLVNPASQKEYENNHILFLGSIWSGWQDRLFDILEKSISANKSE